MSKFVREEVAEEAEANGVFVGRSHPTWDSDGTWWEIYRHDNKLISCVMSKDGVICGAHISEDELSAYIEDN